MAEINVTPMADVMIVLLIIFMVTTPLITSETLPLPPASHAREDDAAKALVLRLDEHGVLTIEDQKIGPYEPALAEVTLRTSADPARPVWIKAHREVPYDWVTAVAEACRHGGGETLMLATDRPAVM
jgi:biopolymer transport protein ExbD